MGGVELALMRGLLFIWKIRVLVIILMLAHLYRTLSELKQVGWDIKKYVMKPKTRRRNPK